MSSEHVRSDIQKYLSADVDTRIAAIHNELWVDNNSSEAVFRINNDVFLELFAFKMIHSSVLSVFFLNFTLK